MVSNRFHPRQKFFLTKAIPFKRLGLAQQSVGHTTHNGGLAGCNPPHCVRRRQVGAGQNPPVRQAHRAFSFDFL